MAQKTCFVVMGFGKKTDFETGRTLDLDKSYQFLIKPAVEAAGLACVRADEIVHSGLIDVPMYEQLLNADVVVADLSTSNKNAFYELGVRHALKPFTTVVIAEDGIKTFPFDVNHVTIRQYRHLGEDIGASEVVRFGKQLTDAIKTILAKNPPDNDSPVYTFLKGLTNPTLAPAAGIPANVFGMLTNAGSENGAVALGRASREVLGTDGLQGLLGGLFGGQVPIDRLQDEAETTHSGTPNVSHRLMMQQVDEAQQRGDFVMAHTILNMVRTMRQSVEPDQPEDPYIIQRLALLTYKSEKPSKQASLDEAARLLATLNPHTTNDTETLGLWGAVNKRLYELTQNVVNLSDAIRAYGRGFYLRNDYYNGINFAFLLNQRAAVATDRAEAIADFVSARRVRKDVLTLCEQWLSENPGPASQTPESERNYQMSRYWVVATKAEAYAGIEEAQLAQQHLQEAFALNPDPWMRTSTEQQLAKLNTLLAASPLQYVQP